MKKLLAAVPLAALALWVALAQTPANPPHFHHFHLNVADPTKSMNFYRQNFGAVPVKFAGRTDALFTERSFILFNRVAAPANATLDTAIWHLGWGGVDLPAEFVYLRNKGVEFQTPLTPLGINYYMYLYGPDKEVIEIWSGFQNHRYGHVHLLASSIPAAVKWYADNLGITMRTPAAQNGKAAPNPSLAPVDNVTFNFVAQPVPGVSTASWNSKPIEHFSPTLGRVVDHIAFSYRNIQPIFDRMKANGVQIVDPIAMRPEYGFKSFTVLGPDGLLIEIVEAKPIPDSSWEAE